MTHQEFIRAVNAVMKKEAGLYVLENGLETVPSSYPSGRPPVDRLRSLELPGREQKIRSNR